MNTLDQVADHFERPAELDLLAVHPDDAYDLDLFRDAMEVMWLATRESRPDLTAQVEPNVARPAWLEEHLPGIAAQLPAPRWPYRGIPVAKRRKRSVINSR